MKSPAPKKEDPKQLTFSEALGEILTGKSVTKLEWADKNIYGILKDERLMLHKSNGTHYAWILSEGDLRGDDFYII